MGERNKFLNAVILNVKNQGENNRTVTVFSAEKGIFYCTLYGGPKSKLRALVQAFNSGTLYYYEDEQKGNSKITDFDVKNSHLSLRTNIFKMCAANLATEIIIKTHCAGDYKNSFILYSALLDGIDICEEKDARLGLIRFLWRYLGLLGVQPDVKACPYCNNLFVEHTGKIFYVENSHSFVCSDCQMSLSNEDILFSKDFHTDVNGMTYLAAINTLSPKQVRGIALDEKTVYELKNIIYYLTEKASSTALISMKDGIGIL